MAIRRRTLLFVLALGFSAAVAPAALATAAPAQDPGATFGTGETATTVAGSTSAPTATTAATDSTNQTLVESEDAPEKPIFTESRKVAAIIGGLVLVALAILLLTVRYIRLTKPVAQGDISDLPFLADDVDVEDDDVFIAELPPKADPVQPVVPVAVPEVALGAAPGTDHASADADWESRTGEHQRVEIPGGTSLARPGVAARRKALGITAD
ncbi:MAG TPA: hypothetical protein VNQ33_10415 [Acidimicrobiales bacterium]|nr:hypothetical protein [Acidimicrobiales bacterium]